MLAMKLTLALLVATNLLQAGGEASESNASPATANYPSSFHSYNIRTLATTQLLGAENQTERDDILEAVAKRLVSKPNNFKKEIRFRFLGFQDEGNRSIGLDPSPELLQRIRRLKLDIVPFSASQWGFKGDQALFDPNHIEYGVLHMVIGIGKVSEDEARVEVNEQSRPASGAERFTYWLRRQNGKWTVTKIEPGSVMASKGGTGLPAPVATNNFVKATPVFAILSCRGQSPGAPYDNRSAVARLA